MPDIENRQKLIEHLKARRILAVFHYQPLNTSEMGLRFGGRPGDCPVTERVADQLIRLPFFNGLKDEELDRVIEAVRSFHP
jgi:dTDP-4-amino-4,6-dideoxygalactose transaminase